MPKCYTCKPNVANVVDRFIGVKYFQTMIVIKLY